MNDTASISARTTTERMRDILRGDGMGFGAGGYDAISALLVQEAGFDCVAIGGFAVSAAVLGMPDAGFADLTINVEGVRRMRDAVTIPIAADADTGYGGAANSYYTALQLARNGADALSIEDQKEPKLCPLLSASPPEVVSLSEAVSRVEAAVAAKRVADICVVARTDARGEAVWPRLEAFASAGAEALYLSVGAFETKAEWKDVISNAPLPMTLTYDSRLAAMFAVNELEDLGCKLLDFPLTPLFAAMKGMRTSLANVMKQKERLADGSELTIEDFKTVISAEKHLLPTLKRG